MEHNKDKVVIGILAHVDAGKTTLSEALLFACGKLRTLGRVDHQDAFLDTSPLERERGITIFSKQARFSLGDKEVILLDTPGHVDFAAEMERTLQVLDYAILVISGTDGVQGHTETLWKLLEAYEIPTFLFVNKRDLPGVSFEDLNIHLKEELSEHCVDFSNLSQGDWEEEVAVQEEDLLEQYLENGFVEENAIIDLIQQRKLYPCYYGSALRMDGVQEFVEGMTRYLKASDYGEEFGAKVYKVTREGGVRLTYIKVTGGNLKVRSELAEHGKVNEIRLYSGEKYETTTQVESGEICALAGVIDTYAGQGLGAEQDFDSMQLEPVLTYRVLFPEGTDLSLALRQMRELEEEDPKLHIIWNEKDREICVQPMGEVQLQVLQRLIEERYGMQVTFGEGSILYRETIENVVEGVGHFEPLRHYAEVQLKLEPLPLGSGIVLERDCSEDKLDLNWQRLILTHLQEKEYVGVLTGSPITDIKITIVGGRAHLKHTEGGDFRQATYRGVRQGLMQAKSRLLEPYYDFQLEIPRDLVGRVMADLQRMSGEFEPGEEKDGLSILTGSCPVATMKDYPVEFASFTKGRGRFFTSFAGYRPCHNEEEVIGQIGYDPEKDLENTADSVFCAHGSGYNVKWDEVHEHMHGNLVVRNRKTTEVDSQKQALASDRDPYATDKELIAIFERTFGPIKRRTAEEYGRVIGKKEKSQTHVTIKERKPVEEYLLVDGYNIIFAWDGLHDLSKTNLDSARTRLMDILCNYQGYKKCHLILVFDAYKVKGNPGSVEKYHNIDVVYTKEAETADMYIEKTTKKIAGKNRVRVATSDGLEQMIILGHGATRVSARAFFEEVCQVEEQIRASLEEHLANQE